MAHQTIPLFPLHSVLFPGGPLQLRIFEPRYLALVSRCLRDESGFGICLIEAGREVGEAAATVSIGTLGHISDWHQRSDGLLGITVTGTRRFRLLTRRVGTNQLIEGEVELLPEPPSERLPGAFRPLAELLDRMLAAMGPPHDQLERQFDDAGWVGARLAELLPLPLMEKQALLELDSTRERLMRIDAALRKGLL